MNNSEVIFSYEAGNYQKVYGARIFADGRYELYDLEMPPGAQWNPYNAASVEVPGGGPQWSAYTPFTPDQMKEIHTAIDKVSTANIPDHIDGSKPIPPDSDSAKVMFGGRKIVIDEWPKVVPAELNELLDLISKFRAQPPANVA